MEKTVTIILDAANGTSELKTKGFKGTACKVASKPYEDALGVVTSDEATPEMAQQTQAMQQQVGA